MPSLAQGEKHRQFLTFDQWDVHAADLADLDAILGHRLSDKSVDFAFPGCMKCRLQQDED